MNEKNVERSVLTVYVIHHIAMFFGALYYDWASWVPLTIILTGVSSCIVVFSQYWDFKLRALFVSVIINFCLIIYGSNADNVTNVIVPFLGVTVVMGLYGIQQLMIVPCIAITFIILFHRFVLHTFSITTIDSVYDYLMPFINIYFIIFVLYFWNMKRNESAKRMGSIIRDLKIAEQGKDDFLANVSHEIRTPVNNVVGMSEVILREKLEDKVKDDVLSIQTSGKQLVAIVSDILDFSELQSDRISLVEEEYNLDLTIKDVISMTEAMKLNKSIDFIVDCDASIPVNLIGDEQKLKRVLLNLLSNAIKFTNEGCVILKIEYRKESYGINLLISVKDTGIGIEKKYLERLFSTYNQVDTKRNRQEGGIGLGLAIAKAIVNAMGGVISVQSQPHKGTEFKVVVPQKVKEFVPVVKPLPSGKIKILSYLDFEQLDINTKRDAYSQLINNMASDINVQMHMCHNLAELKRRVERDSSNIILISFYEYKLDSDYFDNLSLNSRVMVVVDAVTVKEISSKSIIKVQKPIYIGTFVEILNPEGVSKNGKLIAPDAEVLVVDDNQINLKVISGLLEPYKVKVTLASSGADALDKIDKNQFDLIFMDHMMPEMDGIETLQRIRNKKGLYFKEVPVIALTANAVAGAREMFLKEGFQEFVSKPVEINILERVLWNFISPNKIVREEEINEVENSMPPEEPETEIKDVEPSAIQEESAELGDINIEHGISFCGSYENLIDILQIHCNDGEENYKKISDFYENRDWKNYTILVHGLKSSMKSVGADVLSEKARLLESASKKLDEEYIYNNHEDMMVEYTRILNILYKYFGVEVQDKEEVCDLPAIEESDFEAFIADFENATYSWDDALIKELLVKINGHSYKNHSMEELLVTLTNKVEMSDYISAFEVVRKWKDKIDRKA